MDVSLKCPAIGNEGFVIDSRYLKIEDIYTGILVIILKTMSFSFTIKF